MIRRGKNLIVGSVLAALVAAGVVFSPAPAVANFCGSPADEWADNYDWHDNYWVGVDYYDGYPSCDWWGNYTMGIQRINWGLGYQWSGIDGIYGTNTQTDIRNFQVAKGLRTDGLVGGGTWYEYFGELDSLWWNGALWIHRAPGYNSGDRNQYFGLDTGENPDRWLIYNKGLTTWVEFSKHGPSQ